MHAGELADSTTTAAADALAQYERAIADYDHAGYAYEFAIAAGGDRPSVLQINRAIIALDVANIALARKHAAQRHLTAVLQAANAPGHPARAEEVRRARAALRICDRKWDMVNSQPIDQE